MFCRYEFNPNNFINENDAAEYVLVVLCDVGGL